METTYYIYNRRTPLSMASPAGTITPVSSLCGSETPTALSPGFEGGFIPISPSGDGGFLSSRTTPAVINDHIRWQHPDTPQTHYFICLVILCHILFHYSQQLGTKYVFAFLNMAYFKKYDFASLQSLISKMFILLTELNLFCTLFCSSN